MSKAAKEKHTDKRHKPRNPEAVNVTSGIVKRSLWADKEEKRTQKEKNGNLREISPSRFLRSHKRLI